MSARAHRFFPKGSLPLVESIAGARCFAVSLERTMLTWFEVAPHTRFEEHHHASEQITLVLAGELTFEIGGEEVRVGPGEVIALPSDLPHAVRSGPEPTSAVDAWSPPHPAYVGPDPE